MEEVTTVVVGSRTVFIVIWAAQEYFVPLSPDMVVRVRSLIVSV